MKARKSTYLNRKYRAWTLFAIIAIGGSTLTLHAQDIEKVAKEVVETFKKKPVTMTGGVSTNHIFYAADGIEDRRNKPYTYFAQGNVNFSIYEKLQVPITFSYTNAKFSYTLPKYQQPFNQVGLSPKYKWVTVHGGYRNMTFSPYTLSGHLFLGGGFELTPGKWTIAGMYGQLQKAVALDTTLENNLPAYKRMGMGLKTGYKSKKGEINLILFQAEDEFNSLNEGLDSVGVLPEENFVWSLVGKKTITPKLKAEAEYANSTYTRDNRSPLIIQDFNVGDIAGVDKRTSTVIYDAIKARLDYSIGGTSIGLAYERIDPEYRTLGAYYFNNDLENATVNFSTSVFKKKVRLAGNVGGQRNNLDQQKLATMTRFVGALNANWQVSKKLGLSGSYSSFQSYTNMRSQFVAINATTQFDNLDTLNYYQITQSANVSINYNINTSKKNTQMLNVNLALQDANDKQEGTTGQPIGSTFYNMNTAYSLGFIPISFTITVNMNANYSKMINGTSVIYGPTIALNKSLFKKKLKSTLSSSWNQSVFDNNVASTILNIRFNNSVTIKKKHSLNLSAVYLDRTQQSTNYPQVTFSEITIMGGYSYRF